MNDVIGTEVYIKEFFGSVNAFLDIAIKYRSWSFI